MKISVSKFAGEKPALDPTVLEVNQAQLAENCYVKRGVLTGIPSLATLEEGVMDGGAHVLADSSTESLRRFEIKEIVDNVSVNPRPYLFRANGVLDMVRSPMPLDRLNRIYMTWNGDSYYTGDGVAIEGAGPYPSRAFKLGVPEPDDGATISVNVLEAASSTFLFEVNYFHENPETGERYNHITLPPPDEQPSIYIDHTAGKYYKVDLVALQAWLDEAGVSEYANRITGGGSASTGNETLGQLLKGLGWEEAEDILHVDGLVKPPSKDDIELAEQEYRDRYEVSILDAIPSDVTPDSTPIDGFDLVKVVRQVSNDGSDLNAIVEGALYYGTGVQPQVADRVSAIVAELNRRGDFLETVKTARRTEIIAFFDVNGEVYSLVEAVPEGSVLTVGVRIFNRNEGNTEVARAYTTVDNDTYNPKYDDGYENMNLRVEGEWDKVGNVYELTVIYQDLELDGVTRSTAYAYTYVSALGEEGPPNVIPGTASITPLTETTLGGLSIAPDDYETLKDFVVNDTNGTSHTLKGTKRIYRYAQGASSGAYLYVGEIGWDVTEFVDRTANDIDLPGGTLDTADYDTPPGGLQGLCSMPNGVLAGYFNNTVCFSEPYLPYAWPVKYQLNVNAKILEIHNTTYGLVVFPEGLPPVVIQGSHPSAMGVSEIPVTASLMAKGLVAKSPTGVAYLSREGLISLSAQGVDDSLWDAVMGESVARADGTYRTLYYDHYFYVFELGTNKGYAIDVRGGTRFSLELGDTPILGVSLEPSEGRFLMSTGDVVKQWHPVLSDGDVPYNYNWQSKRFNFVNPVSLSTVRVDATGAGTFTYSSDLGGWAGMFLFQEGKHTYRLPAGLIRELEFTIAGAAEIRLVEFASSIAELHHG
jgi:hypothetical protein